MIDTSNANSKVEIINISNSYIGRSGDWPGTFTWQDARNVTIQNSGGGVVTGVHMRGLQANTAALANLAIFGSPTVNDITLDNSTLCFPGQKTNAPNIALVNDASTLAIRNNTIAAACDGTTFDPNKATANITFGSSNHNNMLIIGNFFARPVAVSSGAD